MYKKILIAMLFLALSVGVVSFVTTNVYAQEAENSLPPMMRGLVERFNLNEDEVGQFFQEQRVQRHASMQDRVEERLAQAVSDGKITEEQMDLLLNKMEEHRQIREQERDEFSTWAEENGINLTDLGLGKHGFGAGAGWNKSL